jgi:hypothetical protein
MYSWQIRSHSTQHKIPTVLWHPMVHYCTRNSPPLSVAKSEWIPFTHLYRKFSNHFSVTPQSTTSPLTWPLPLSFQPKLDTYSSSFPCVLHAHPSHKLHVVILYAWHDINKWNEYQYHHNQLSTLTWASFRLATTLKNATGKTIYKKSFHSHKIFWDNNTIKWCKEE